MRAQLPSAGCRPSIEMRTKGRVMKMSRKCDKQKAPAVCRLDDHCADQRRTMLPSWRHRQTRTMRPQAVSGHGDSDLLRDQRRVERDMLGVAEDKLNRVLSWRELDAGLRLTGAEMQMLLVLRDRRIRV